MKSKRWKPFHRCVVVYSFLLFFRQQHRTFIWFSAIYFDSYTFTVLYTRNTQHKLLCLYCVVCKTIQNYPEYICKQTHPKLRGSIRGIPASDSCGYSAYVFILCQNGLWINITNDITDEGVYGIFMETIISYRQTYLIVANKRTLVGVRRRQWSFI